MIERYTVIPLLPIPILQGYDVKKEAVKVVQLKAERDFQELRAHYKRCGCGQCRQIWMRSELWFDGRNGDYFDTLYLRSLYNK